ncbi:hypothetical protein A7985_10210 [Pseudoalteromonas luteoviolacea]|uniref:Formyl transferase N-terminal domain-containing protein n=1 Tax=Pseudoalteromonas luteoviolacea TaxID=43657 RepID=A0A1C0TSB9_9GAMM|nr:formyltransferase family protein [Pseudoalteromonas luteoviolacea]MBQ4810812.1 hypothetical protein [Pseudoalteromonas luteoviolacea]OCQ22153.1 hypothetical protein A7985_10210 [Pseudoalteromonas luteoviolacea]
MRLALCNIENMATQPAILEVIENHKDAISLVITSNPYSAKNGGFLRQAYQNICFRGYRFTEYLFVKMVFLNVFRPLLKLFGLQVLPSIEQRCEELGISYIHVKDINTSEVVAMLKSKKIDLLTIFYFDQILQADVIAAPRKGVVNFHPALLPSCRGLFPIMFSYLYNDRQYGISAHWIENTEIDAGPIIAQQQIEVPHATCLLDIDRQVSNWLPKMYDCVIGKIAVGDGVALPQSEAGSYYSYPNKAHLKTLSKSLKMIRWRWVLGAALKRFSKGDVSLPVEK